MVLDRLDQILLNNSIEILMNSGAEKVIVFGSDELIDIKFQNNEYPGKILCVSPEPGENPAMFTSDIVSKSVQKKKALLLYSNIAGLEQKLLDDMQNLLNIEEDVCVVYSTGNNKLCGIGLLRYDEGITEIFSDIGVVDTIEFVKKHDRYFILRNSIHLVETVADLKQLYIVLSNRDNNHLCSKYFYDQLTEVFIETKELLK